jgi:hypothetical protein
MVKAPVMQPLTQYGCWQCRQETAKLMPSFSSMRTLGLMVMPFSARAMSLCSVPAKAQ